MARSLVVLGAPVGTPWPRSLLNVKQHCTQCLIIMLGNCDVKVQMIFGMAENGEYNS